MDNRESVIDQDDDRKLAQRLSNEFYLGRAGGSVPWARRGIWSRVIASVLRPRPPAILVLSLPRSGSSWVGSVLGGAPDALYLREPVTQSDPAITQRNVFNPLDHPELLPSFERLADRAFAGLPDFKDTVVYDPDQWSLLRRRGRRLVIKEVNTRACRWFVERYRPRVIFLLRHPAAVAWSSQRHGWIGPTPEDWECRGRDVGQTLVQACDALRGHTECATVTFESLCTDPIEGFHRLFEFAGLTWTQTVAERIRENARVSRQKIDAWRAEADPECVRAMKRAHLASGAPWYRSDEEW
jgi:hypothetical protein